MFKHILVPTDGSPLSDAVITKAIGFARETGARLTFFSAVPTEPLAFVGEASSWAGEPTETKRGAIETAVSLLDKAKEEARTAGVSSASFAVASECPADAIVVAALGQGCDLIFMASHGRRGISALLLGSETQKVLAQSTVPVLVFR